MTTSAAGKSDDLQQCDDEKSLAFALVGAGNWGRNHTLRLYERGALASVVDESAAALDTLRDSLVGFDSQKAGYASVFARSWDASGVVLTHDLEEALADPRVSAVVVAVPSHKHFEVARICLERGKHVLVEKPICLEEHHALKLIEVASANRRVLMVGHLVIYDPEFQVMLRAIKQGRIGRVRHMYATRLSLGRFRPEESVASSLASHDIAMILHVASQTSSGPHDATSHTRASEFNVISASECRTTGFVQPDFASLTLRNDDLGIDAHVVISWIHPFKQRQFVVSGERGTLVYDALHPDTSKHVQYFSTAPVVEHDGTVRLVDQGAPSDHAGSGAVQDLLANVDKSGWSDPLSLEHLHFEECIRSGAMVQTDGLQGFHVLRILNGAKARCLTSEQERERLLSMATMPRAPKTDAYFQHESAVVDSGAHIGAGTKIWHFCHVMSAARIGRNCSFGQNVFIGQCEIGNGVKVQNNVSIYDGVVLGDDVFLGPSMVFTNIRNPRSAIVRKGEFVTTRVERGVTVGANATIVCGVTLHEFSFVGAGAVVTKDVGAYEMVWGNPARVHAFVSKEGYRLVPIASNGHIQYRCSVSQQLYEMRARDPTRESQTRYFHPVPSSPTQPRCD
ncbi:UDP-2-acetamido-3-amino-2,3-dideoxy-D-glucuronate N-acetyltransferase [Porphyridium purpureum]|uniref:UDP-2-acetamido-3-amino-2, 3-dideoxy-D-glucuronate N-acetyltransferase n=1 Tax=Porphyridium purpureum TaxID=35688 RepID=A0A5J4YWE9_PORPP|nr:UDP-2-acetamido-3-amino-2,3-dideoxy-D-glucuronate N-acetyltransferase [Porphyridium purpureum]|eukprot:POR6491..scf227_4